LNGVAAGWHLPIGGNGGWRLVVLPRGPAASGGGPTGGVADYQLGAPDIEGRGCRLGFGLVRRTVQFPILKCPVLETKKRTNPSFDRPTAQQTMAGVSASIPCVVLNTGHAMPVLGFGTGSSSTPEDLPATILHAVRLGYRHIDTASMYGTEGAVGAAVSDAVAAGAVTSRADLFITSKLVMKDAHPDRVLPAIRESLARLGLDYLDLFLVHWPVAADENNKPVPFDMEGVWHAMEECHRIGLARSVGVSNFSAAKMSRLLAFAAVPPAVNQVEVNVGWRQEKVREACAKNGVVVTAFSPLGAIGTAWGSNAVMESGALEDIAARRGKTIAQVSKNLKAKGGKIGLSVLYYRNIDHIH
jgi:3''-deamino-3''-oxonicotianamine reductase